MKRILYISFIILFCNQISLFSQPKKSTFYTSDGKLFDKNSNEFIIRGVNNPHIWLPLLSYDALHNIAATGSNTVRLVWMTRGEAAELDIILKRIKELGMIAMPEIHDFTGDTTISGVENAAFYWSRPDVKAVLDKYKPTILLNIANEWLGNRNDSIWFAGYKSAISIMRKAGLEHCIVIDGAGWGQDLSPIKNHAFELTQLDSLHNLLFDVHMYGSWNDTTTIKSELEYIKDNKIPLVVGEFGYDAFEGKNNLGCRANAPCILQTCQKLGIGYMAWSWCGNNQENQWLDMVNNWKEPTLWGELVINSKNGIKATSKKCSVFK